MLREWERRFPGRVENTFNALARVVPSHLMDASLFGFRDLEATGVADAGGDIAFDEAPCAAPDDGSRGVVRITRFDD